MGESVIRDIYRMKAERNAVILAHSYQPPEIQDIADHVDDSLQLSRIAASTDASVIVLCGVRFMAETAHILAPDKIILHPEPKAGCPLADCIDVPSLRSIQAAFPDSLTVLYVNSPAEVKAESYACCTSANALEVVESVPSDSVIFAPDRNLGMFISRRSDKEIHVWNGACRTHAIADIQDIKKHIEEWPDAELLVHPETSPEIWDIADAVLGTGGMIRHVSNSRTTRFIIGTEEGMVYKLKTLYPDREFIAAGKIYCPNMKVITLQKILDSLMNLDPAVRLDPEVREKAYAAVARMAEIAG